MVFTITKNVNITNSNNSGSVWKQILMAFFASLPYYTHGIETTVLFSSAHSGHFINTKDDELWSTTAMILGAGLSAPVYCYLIDRFGRKCGIYAVSFAQAVSCIPLFLSPNEVNYIILHTLAGISSGGLFTVLPTYIREISSTSIRGFTLSLMMAMVTLGYLMKLVMAIEEMMYLMVALVAVQFIMMLVLLESPSYLIMVGNIEGAKANIAKLSCLSQNNPTLSKEMSYLKEESDRARSKGKLTLCEIMKNKIWLDGTKIGIVLYSTMVLSGSIVFLDQDKTLAQLKMPSDPNKTLVLSCLFAGSLFSVMLIRVLDRKYLLTMAFGTMVLSMGVLAIYTQADLTVATMRWVPVAALGVLVFCYGAAWGLPIVIMVEIYNFEIRAFMLGVLYTYSQILKLVHVHTFKYIEDYMGVYTVLYIFASINIYGAVYTFFVVPDIKDKSVKQIEKQLKRIPLLKFNIRNKV